MRKFSMYLLAMAMATGMAFAQTAPAQNSDAKKVEQKPAGPPPTPVGSMVEPSKLYERAVGQVEKEFVSLAEAMPADKYDFAPTTGEFKGVRTFGEQVKHVAQANMAFYGAVLGQKASEEEMKASEALKGKDQIVAMLKKSFEMGHQAAATVNAQNAFQTVQSPFGPGGVSRAGMMMTAVAHAFDHYGQMVEYGRMNGIVPPASQR
ncbi:MAG: DinB family protein [Acidobacteriaceae bacterium]